MRSLGERGPWTVLFRPSITVFQHCSRRPVIACRAPAVAGRHCASSALLEGLNMKMMDKARRTPAWRTVVTAGVIGLSTLSWMGCGGEATSSTSGETTATSTATGTGGAGGRGQGGEGGGAGG